MNDLRDFSKRYLEILEGDLSGLNLTRILNPDEFYYKQIIDSIKPFEESDFNRKLLEDSKVIVDVGFGGGFPLCVLAHSFPNKVFIGFEARDKKVNAVNLICEKLGIKNVRVFHKRVEEIDFDMKCLITFKAVGKIHEYLSYINSDLDISALFYKGPSSEQVESFEKISNWSLTSKEFFKIPTTDERSTYVFKKNLVPRGTIKKKNLVKVSNLL